MLRSALAVVAVVASATVAMTNETHAQSFNCKTAKTSTEVAICQTQSLAWLDDAVAVAYRDGLRQPSAYYRKRLQQTQVEWLRVRNACGNGVECIKAAYHARLAWIKDVDGEE